MNRDNNIFDGPLLPIEMGIYSNPHGIGIDMYQRQFPSPFTNSVNGNELPYLIPQIMGSFGGYPTQQFHPYLYRPMIHESINSSQLTSEPNLLPSCRITNFLPPYPFQEGNFFPSSIMYLPNNSQHPKFFSENESLVQGMQEGSFNRDNILPQSPQEIQNTTILPNTDSNYHRKSSKSRNGKLVSPSSQRSIKSPQQLDFIPKNFQDKFKEELQNELKIATDLNDTNSSTSHQQQIVQHSTIENRSSSCEDYHVKFSQTNIIKLSSNTVFNVVSHGRSQGVVDEGITLSRNDDSMNHEDEKSCSNGCMDYRMDESCDLSFERLPANVESANSNSKDFMDSNNYMDSNIATVFNNNKSQSPFITKSTIPNGSTMVVTNLISNNSPSSRKNNKKLSLESNIIANRKFNRKKIKELSSSSCPSSSANSPASSIPIGVAKALQRSKSIDSKDEIINYSKTTNIKECVVSNDFLINARTNLIYPLINSQESESHCKEFDLNIKSPLDLCINSANKSLIYKQANGCSQCGRPYKVDVVSRSTSPIVFTEFVHLIPNAKYNVEDNKMSVFSGDNAQENNVGVHRINGGSHSFLDADFKSNIFKNMLEDPSCQKTNLFLNLANKNYFAHLNINSGTLKFEEQTSNSNTGLLGCEFMDRDTTELFKCVPDGDNIKPTECHNIGDAVIVKDVGDSKLINTVIDNASLTRVDSDEGNGLNMLSSIALECKDSPDQLNRRRCSLLDFPISQLMLLDNHGGSGKDLKDDNTVPRNSSSSEVSRIVTSASSEDDVFEKLLPNESQLRTEIVRIQNEFKCEFKKRRASHSQNTYKNSSNNLCSTALQENIKTSKNLKSKNYIKDASRKKVKRVSQDVELNSANKRMIKKTRQQATNAETLQVFEHLKNENLAISELVDGLNILYKRDNLYVEARLQAISPPDIYGILVENERTRKPDIVCQEEVLANAVKIVKPKNKLELKEGMRVCAHWSRKFSCLYPGIVHDSSDDEDNADDDDDKGVTISFDDGDTGRIPIECVRVLPRSHSPRKKEKSTDCDSALIPLLCVHG